jgi:DNA-binding PadR family transcriptional regulator
MSHPPQLSGLRGVLLALIVQEGNKPLGGYLLGTLVERRLGRAWQITRQGVYGALDRLEEEGLVESAAPAAAGRAGTVKRVYTATDWAEPALAAWMESPSKEPVRVELRAKIGVSRPEDARRLLGALDIYERECFETLRKSSAAEVPISSWTGLAMNLTRLAVDESLQAELRWIALARRWIEDFLADRPIRPLP